MPHESPEAAGDTAEALAAVDAAPIPATPPAITEAALVFEAAVRAWWANQTDPGTVTAVASAITAYMVVKNEPYLEPPMGVRTHFARFRSANLDVVRQATTTAIGILIPATMGAGPLPNLPVVTNPNPTEGAD